MKIIQNQNIFYVIGVSGCGKSTVGRLLAEKLVLPFFDGDDFHPEENIRKMKSGTPLTDDDRREWLESLNHLSAAQLKKNNGAVIACSALKKSYRRILLRGMEKQTAFIYLEGSFDQIRERLQKRSGHFMPAGLLKSQFEALEPPENGITVSIGPPPEDIVSEILKRIQGCPTSKTARKKIR